MNCTHRWLVDTPKGTATLGGECKRCGATRTFPASFEERDIPGGWKAPAKALKAAQQR